MPRRRSAVATLTLLTALLLGGPAASATDPTPPAPDPQSIQVEVPSHPGAVLPLKPSPTRSVKGVDLHRHPTGGVTLPFTGADVIALLAIAALLIAFGWALLRSRVTAAGLVAGAGGVAVALAVRHGGDVPPTVAPPTPEAAPAALEAAWPAGAPPEVAATSAAGVVVPAGTPVAPGEVVRLRASGFVPGERVVVDGRGLRASRAGVVSYEFTATVERDVVLRGQVLVAAWHVLLAS